MCLEEEIDYRGVSLSLPGPIQWQKKYQRLPPPFLGYPRLMILYRTRRETSMLTSFLHGNSAVNHCTIPGIAFVVGVSSVRRVEPSMVSLADNDYGDLWLRPKIIDLLTSFPNLPQLIFEHGFVLTLRDTVTVNQNFSRTSLVFFNLEIEAFFHHVFQC